MKKLSIALVLFITTSLFADWNEAFDQETHFLIQKMECLQGNYKTNYDFFIKVRKGILKDLLLKKQIAATKVDQKMILLRPRDGLVIKKRARNNIQELFTWEFSYLIGGDFFLVPSFPVEIGGKKIIVQKMEPFEFKKDPVAESIPKEVKKVSIEEYWMAHFQAYLLGLSDLVGQNVGVNKIGHIRFFDMESSFHFCNQVVRTERSFKPGFLSQSLEWPQYRQALDAQTASKLRRFVDGLSSVEERLETYLSCRNAPLDVDAFLFRLNKVRSFPLNEGVSFKDFYAFLFPEIAPGLDELSWIASDILKRKVGHGSALILICRWLDRYTVSHEQRMILKDWIDRYIDMGD